MRAGRSKAMPPINHNHPRALTQPRDHANARGHADPFGEADTGIQNPLGDQREDAIAVAALFKQLRERQAGTRCHLRWIYREKNFRDRKGESGQSGFHDKVQTMHPCCFPASPPQSQMSKRFEILQYPGTRVTASPTKSDAVERLTYQGTRVMKLFEREAAF